MYLMLFLRHHKSSRFKTNYYITKWVNGSVWQGWAVDWAPAYIKKRSNNWWCSDHTSTDQTPNPCAPFASPGFNPGGGWWWWGVVKLGLSYEANKCSDDWGWWPRHVTYLWSITMPWWCRLNPSRVNAAASTSVTKPRVTDNPYRDCVDTASLSG